METNYAINKALYQERINRNISLKEAAKQLNINSLHLSLIEKGYLRISQKLRLRFIAYYQLPNNFFETFTTYIEPINTQEAEINPKHKIRNIIVSTKTRIISGVLMLAMLGTLIGGIYIGRKFFNNPRETWTQELTSFREDYFEISTLTTKEELLLGDTAYILTVTDSDANYDYDIKTTMYQKDLNAQETNIVFALSATDESITFSVGCYNRRIIAFVDMVSARFAIDGATCFIEGNNNFNLRPFDYIDEYFGTTKHADENNPVYKEVNNIVKDTLTSCMNIYKTKVINVYNFGYKDTYSLLKDIQIVSRNYIFNFRLGFYMTLYSAILLVLSSCILLLSFILKSKKLFEIKHKEKPAVKFSLADVSLPVRDLPSDNNMPLVIPECALRVVGLILILLFAIFVNIATYLKINTNLFTPNPAINNYSTLSSNLLIAGTTLIFFLKLDVYHKKSQKDLIINIALLFIAGLIYYIAEVILYSTFHREFAQSGTMYAAIFEIIISFLPGNIIWNLMLYSCIFLFLFTTPKRIEDQPHKIVCYRACSFIPTFLLIVGFIVNTFIKSRADVPFQVSCIFFSKGILITLFAILYLYSLYLLRLYYIFRFGKSTSEIYFNSRNFALAKNVAASIIILVLLLIDLFFKYKMPDNIVNLGNNWVIGLLIPFILFYRPHIGKRNAKWDRTFMIMYVIFFASGYLINIAQVALLFNFNQIAEILN